MIDHIYIPTLGRANNQITFDNMPPKVQEITSKRPITTQSHTITNR